MKIKKKKNDGKKDVLVLILYLFLSLIIPSTAISFFAMSDKNIKEKKEIIDNNKQTNAANFDKEELLQKIITLLLKGSSSSKYNSSKVDLNIVGVRVLLVYGLTYVLSLAITAITNKNLHVFTKAAKGFWKFLLLFFTYLPMLF